MTADSRSVLAALGAALAIGCSDDSQRPSLQAPAVPVPVPQVQAPGSVDRLPLPEPFRAGIDLSRPGYPAFVAEVSGVSAHEPWGRWTDANLSPTARFRFSQPLPDRFTLRLQAHGIGPNATLPVRVVVGGVERRVILGEPPREVYEIPFEGTKGPHVLEIIPPKPILAKEVTPASADPRRLGIGIKSISFAE